MAGNIRQTESADTGGQRRFADGLTVARANFRCAYRLVRTLADCGVANFVVSAGARCVPLVAAAAALKDAAVRTHPDERSAAFLALGIGKALRRPAVLICTSGTAAANIYPALIEARMSHTPLIILTADRPPRLQECGAPQTIAQAGLYAGFPVYECNLPLPDRSGSGADAWHREAQSAWVHATGSNPGPVHLNTPFAEPLLPPPDDIAALIRETESSQFMTPDEPDEPDDAHVVSDQDWATAAGLLQQSERVLIVCGPQNAHDDFDAAVRMLALRLNAPVLADIGSQVRFVSEGVSGICAHYDFVLRDRNLADVLRPDCVLRLGGLPTSKVVNEWLAGCKGMHQIAIAAYLPVPDPCKSATLSLQSDLKLACAELAGRLPHHEHGPSSYRDRWQSCERTARVALESFLSSEDTVPLFEGKIAATLFETAPADTIIYLSNSMPVRLADMFATTRHATLRVLVNRGANGIDGVISTAAGATAALGRPVVLLIGDIAFLHDLNGLHGLASQHLPLKIVLIDNNGGGIFSHLPLREHTGFFEPLVAMPHNLNLALAGALFGIPVHAVQNINEFRSACQAAFDRSGPEIFLMHTDRDVTHDLIQRAAHAVSAHIQEASPSA